MGWLAGWAKRVKINIDSGDIGAALVNFPVLIYLSTSSGRNGEDVTFVFDEVGANSLKIAVTEDDGVTECKVEIERWDAGNEKAWLWVKVPSISSAVDTDIYLYYDNDHADNNANVGVVGSAPGEAVWDANFKCVLHLSETAGDYLDSTNQDNDASITGTVTRGNIQKIGLGADISGSNDYIEIDTVNLGGGWNEMTAEIFTKYDSVVGDRTSIGAWGGVDDIFLIYYDATGTTRHRALFKHTGGVINTYFGDDPCAINTWYYLGATYEQNVDGLAWFNGSPTSMGGAPNNPLDSIDYKIRIGIIENLSKDLDGQVDEIRISNVKRSTAWMVASRESGNDDLLDFGGEEEVAEEGGFRMTLSLKGHMGYDLKTRGGKARRRIG